ncbi:MAG: hypothetical protein IT557_07020 [Alphaproteobacteria bacterium]|nr:hypothetical protein [Alphaproteobacteria bacterium]
MAALPKRMAKRMSGLGLAAMIAPVKPEIFFAEYFERRHLKVARKRPDYYAGLLSLADIDHAITALGPSHPDVDMANARATEPGKGMVVEDFTHPSGFIDQPRLFQHYADGASIVLPQLHHRLPKLAAFCRALEKTFSCAFQTNIYLTPGGDKQGFRPHFDSHDVFVLQVLGRKHWTIYDTPVELPLRGQRYSAESYRIGAVSERFVLEQGDMLYIPRGLAHDAASDDTLSLHITVGMLSRAWIDLVIEAVSELALNDVAFRRALPPGYHEAGPANEAAQAAARATFAELMRRVAEKAALGPALDRMAGDFVAELDPVLPGQLFQMERLASLGPRSCLRARPDPVWRWQERGGKVELTVPGGKTVSLPAHAGPALRKAMAGAPFRPADLPGLDAPGRLVLLRRLVREGLVEILD